MYIHNYNILTSSLCLYTFSKLELREIASDNFKDGLRVVYHQLWYSHPGYSLYNQINLKYSDKCSSKENLPLSTYTQPNCFS